MATTAKKISGEFSAYLMKPIQKFVLDLSDATVVEVLEQYQSFKKKQSSRFSISSVIYNIRKVESGYGVTLMPLQITDDFYVHFISFLLQGDCCLSTIETYCSQLRAALSWGTRHNLQVSPSYDQFQTFDYRSAKVALTPDEVSMIYHYDIDHNFRGRRKDFRDTLKKVRDMFVLSCNLAQRYSDMKRITPSCFSEDGMTFRIRQQKTNNEAVVNIPSLCFDRKMVRTILERYNYSSPYSGSINNYNNYLHELMRQVGFDEMVKSENKVRGEMQIKETPKWKAISSHTGRRTFATYNIRRGIAEINIRRATGHTDSRNFAKYIIWGENE